LSFLADQVTSQLQPGQAGSGQTGVDDRLIRQLAELAPFPFIVTRLRDQVVVLINERAARLFKVPVDSAAGQFAPDYYCDPVRRRALLDRLRSDHSVTDFDADLRDAEGTVFPALLSAGLLDYAGESCVAITINNVARQVHTEAALNASEARFQRFAEATSEGVLQHVGGGIVDVNPAAAALFGYGADALIGMRLEDLLAEGNRAEFSLRLDRASDAPFDSVGRHRDGTAFPIRIVIKAPDTGSQSRLVVVRDLSERRRTEEALRRSEMRFRSLVENLRDIIFYRGQPNGEVLLFGRDVDALAGTRTPEGTANLPKWYASIHPDDLGRYMELENRRRVGGEGYTIEFRIRHAETGLERWVRERAYVVIDPETGEQFNDGYIMDIGREKVVQEQLRAAKEEAEVANRTKTLFLANMSHELRTPLNAIIGFSEIIQSQIFGPVGSDRYLAYAKDIRDSGKHLLEIINDILDLAKIEVGKFELHEEDCDVAAVIPSALRFVRDRAQASGLKVEMQLAANLPMVRADQRALKQILLNLLSNAIKFTPSGGRIEIGAGVAEDGRFRLSVSDSGIGMAAEDVPRALEAFGQIDNSLSRRYEGTGLGLPLVKAFAELHGGTIEIDSTVDVGTTVHVLLPKERILVAAPATAAVASAG
jgi:PAS domain S-box-containing protein